MVGWFGRFQERVPSDAHSRTVASPLFSPPKLVVRAKQLSRNDLLPIPFFALLMLFCQDVADH